MSHKKDDDGVSRAPAPITPVRGGCSYTPKTERACKDFKKWARRDKWYWAEGAMLLLGFEPFDVRRDYWPRPPAPGFDDIYQTLGRSSMSHSLRPPEFLAWARKKEYLIPRELEEAVSRFHSEVKDTPRGGAGGAKWPWGNHETERLRQLAGAAERFWKNYDPGDPTTAPTNDQVTDWLKGNGVPTRTAEVMATILRADRLPTGPRKK